MSMSDPISDMLCRINNSIRAQFNRLDIPASKLKTNIAKVMKEEGFIQNYKIIKDNKQGILRIYLKYDKNRTNAIIGMKRISKPSRRVYLKNRDIKPFLNGMGVSIISTSGGVMTDTSARNENVGGEILCQIW
ncbi:30S ribosomal protein S8 [Desulfococcaceae bacterium HSG7]|nr:30S ribosomal protein S8 [Desulfococcaceae bacterium HSG9]MDM8553786.1 30S ribosomal protein S8 [Desulfococcaceae bacterium HSG7]